MTVVRFVLPVRSPRPLTQPWTWRAPLRTAAIAFATAQPVSSWPWIAIVTSSRFVAVVPRDFKRVRAAEARARLEAREAAFSDLVGA